MIPLKQAVKLTRVSVVAAEGSNAPAVSLKQPEQPNPSMTELAASADISAAEMPLE